MDREAEAISYKDLEAIVRSLNFILSLEDIKLEPGRDTEWFIFYRSLWPLSKELTTGVRVEVGMNGSRGQGRTMWYWLWLSCWWLG